MLFTVIIPTYNMSHLLSKSLNSLVSQTNQDFEVLIIDDGSTDKTSEVIKPYLKLGSNWRYFKKSNGHWGSVINYVLQNDLIQGKYVTILDADDWFDSNALFDVSKTLNDLTPKPTMLISNIKSLSRNKQKKHSVILCRKSQYILNKQAHTPYSTPHGKFYAKSLFEQLTPLKEGVAYQDMVLYNQLVSKADSIYFLNQAFTTWWLDRSNNSSQAPWDETRVKIWLDTLATIYLQNPNPEIVAYSLMYLWFLARNVKQYQGQKLTLDVKSAKFTWIPSYVRMIIPIKTYFKLKTKKFWTQVNQ